ncbi:MAG: monofunctional biosynthetic peptidoglycan transglycosylase [Hyphomicrobium sp.]|nr:monofunctional biosynthetic peptidoglycan transglycosylase [Hyphomicrobium sp.]PPC79591.1 MAG: monofunctional biosynthetic peptidoglycan transglycosylase [Hyphomicrobium sp.]
MAYYSVLAATGWLMVVLGLIVLYRTVDPPFSNLMLFNRISGDVVVQKWLPIEQVPAQLIRAIVVSEDGRFCSHRGIDFKEIEDAIERAKDGTPRGASTISMQVTKNLFLWPAKSYLRKAIELPLTLVIEALWTKRRIFEVYVNIAEWGPGVFGAEAAAGYHFGKSASRVSEREAALLAVALPNPVTRDAGDPGPGTERLANTIQARMRALSRAASCVERKPRVPAT